MTIELINYKRKNKSLLMDELFTFMLFSNEFELIDLGLFDPAYLEI